MLKITKNVLECIKNVAKHSSVEQGFVLGCTSRLDRIDVFEQIPAVQAGVYFYSPNTNVATETVGRWLENDICFCGFIHSHKINKRDFSEPDIQFAEKLLANFRIPYLWFGLLVSTEQQKELLFYKLYSIGGKAVLKQVQWCTEEKKCVDNYIADCRNCTN